MAKTAKPFQIERKVVVATVLSAAATIALEVLRDESLMHYVPASLQPFVRVLLPIALTFLGGYVAKHSLRSDLEELGREALGVSDGASVAVTNYVAPAAPAVSDEALSNDGPDNTV